MAALQVEVRLLDGQLIHGMIPEGDSLSGISELKLIFMGHDISLALAKIRSVASHAWLTVPPDDVNAASVAPPLEHEEPCIFHAIYVDGERLDGQTRGYENRKSGGLYLYVKQDDIRHQALWIPRHALKTIRMEALTSSPVPAPVSETPHIPLATTMSELASLLENARTKPMMSLAEALFELKLLEASQLEALQSGKGVSLRAYVDERLAASESFKLQLEHARARMVKTPDVDADLFQVEPAALRKLAWPIAARHAVVPLGLLSGTLYVASASPMSRELQDRLSMIAGCSLALVWAARSQIETRLTRENKTSGLAPANVASLPGQKAGLPEASSQDLQSLLVSAQNEIMVHGAEVHSNAVDERSSVVLLVKRIILDANRQRASDIHIETNPGEQVSRVRFRIDGDLEDYLKLPADLRSALVSRIKVMSKLDISERRRPQDGKINFADFSNIKLELRVAILPTHDNLEDVVMRLLASSKPIPLAQLGFSRRDAEIVQRLSQRPYGLLLACGPTGSGKTTTLHSLLSEINTDNRKIWTAEDPIEITQAGLRQLQVNPKIGLTFAAAMRAFLRADPDVIMIGEVRDEETARVCIEASLTGHLVFSTLHTNGAAESVIRLLDLGMDPMNFGDSLIGIVAQRLVRGLCQQCATTQVLSSLEFDALVQEYVSGTEVSPAEGRKRLLAAAPTGTTGTAPNLVTLHQAVGCDRCGGRGYKGRMGIYEVLENVGDMKHKIQMRAPTSEIFTEASRAGMRTLRQDALEKVVGGHIDLLQARSIYA